MLSKYESSNPTKPNCALGLESCDAIIYGSLIRSLREVSLYPPVKPEDATMNVEQLEEHLKMIRIHILPDHMRYSGVTRDFSHNHCSVTSLGYLIDEVLAEPVDPLLDVHRAHFKAKN